jgi:hypothetical protein
MIVLNVTTETQVVQPTLQWETSYRCSIPGRLKIAAVVSKKIFRIFYLLIQIRNDFLDQKRYPTNQFLS